MTLVQRLIIPLTLIALLSGCGGGGGGGGNSGGTIPIPPPVTGTNQSPAITSISPAGTANSPVKVLVGSTQRVVVSASDPDKDALTYTWSVDSGTMTGIGNSIDFKAPATPILAVLTVQVNDGKGHTVSGKCYLSVYKVDTPPPPEPDPNDPPVIASLVANPDSVEVNGTSTLTCVATDKDGDALTYTWSANGGGIQSQMTNTAVWNAPDIAGGCTVTCSVSDGTNPAVSKSVAISVAGSPEEPPVTNGLNASYIQNDGVMARPDLSRGTVVFTRVDATINFDWGQKAPDPRLITLPETENGHDYGVVWTGYIKCEAAGSYVFAADFDDGFSLWISNDANEMVNVIDAWTSGTAGAGVEGQITLEGGKWYKFEADYFEDEDRAYAHLYWRAPGDTEWSIIPTAMLRTGE